MGGTVVAVGAVHQALVTICNLVLGERLFYVRVLGDLAVFVLDGYIGDIESLLVTGNKGHLFTDMPMYPIDVRRLWIAPDVNEHIDCSRRVFLVGSVMIKNLLAADVEFLRPVTMFTGFPRRAQI